MLEYTKWRKMLMIGIIGSFITTVLGDMPIGWVIYPETGNKLLNLALGCGNLTVLQMACGLFFGAVFIPLQYYGVKAIAEIISKTEHINCAKIIEAGAKAYAFIGGTVHVLCVAVMFLCSIENVAGFTQIPHSVMDFSKYLILPVTTVFIFFYISMCIAIAVPILIGKTFLPKWAVIFNPLTGKILLNALAMFGLNTEFFNAIRMGNMGVGALMTFAAFYALLSRAST
ncbi:MAG: hypothetical protein GYA87_08625 [Christensenellaceae bacterium]|nr:hypothetical protein [Christensenellaceae bacterium]